MPYEFNFDESTFISVDVVASGMGRAVVPLIFRNTDGTVHNQGTAFCLAGFQSGEALFATARHVVAELDEPDLAIEPFVLLPRADSPNALVGVRVRQIAIAETHSDVALVIVNINEADFPVAVPKTLSLTFGPPKLGQNTMALGYGHADKKVPGAVSLSYNLSASRGEVTKLYDQHRDKILVNFPAFETTGLYKPSMSGGPIIDTDGAVVGLITTGFETGDGETPIGHGACTGALAELKVELTTDQGVVAEFPISRLAEIGVLGSDGTKLSLHRSDDGVQLVWPTE